jgi:hypothetical protein
VDLKREGGKMETLFVYVGNEPVKVVHNSPSLLVVLIPFFFFWGFLVGVKKSTGKSSHHA